MSDFLKFIHRTPFFRILIPFLFGIAIQDYFQSDFLFSGFLICAILLILIIGLCFWRTQRGIFLFGICSTLFLFAGGMWWNEEYHIIHQPTEYSTNAILCCRLNENPQKKIKTWRSQATIKWIREDKSVHPSNETILLYFKDYHQIGKTYSLHTPIDSLHAGSVILIRNQLQQLKDHGNPFEFSYRNYMNRQNIFRMAYLKAEDWIMTPKTENTPQIYTANIRDQLIKSFQKSGLSGRNLAVLSALTIGYEQDLDQQMKKAFVAAGTMHLLAVSGMHVVLIYSFFKYLLFFFNRNRKTIFIRNLIIFIAIWFFSFLAGMAPSILRASVMICFLLVAETIDRNCNIYNSLAASAFLLILWDPNNLFNAGFQLSYTAVLGIVYYEPQLISLWSPNNKIINWLWATTCLSIAAQLGTFPIVLFDFNQFPNYFIFSNIISGPLSLVLMGLSLALPVTLPIISVNQLIAQLTNIAINIFDWITLWFDHLPGSVTAGLHPSLFCVFLLYLIPVLFFLWIKKARSFYLFSVLSLCCLLGVFSLNDTLHSIKQNRIILYNYPKQLTIHLIQGRQSNLLVWGNQLSDSSAINYLIHPVENKLNLNNTHIQLSIKPKNKGFFFNPNFVVFEGKNFLIPDSLWLKHPIIPFQNADYIILKSPISPSMIINLGKTFPKALFITIDHRTDLFFRKKTLNLLHVRYMNIANSGALNINLSR